MDTMRGFDEYGAMPKRIAPDGLLTRVNLLEATDADFLWLAGFQTTSGRALNLPPGGVDTPDVIESLRVAAARQRTLGHAGAWLIQAGGEIVGLISYKAPPRAGQVELGYGVASARRGRGYASAAVQALVALARLDARVHTLVTETSVSNRSSGRVLEKAGFAPVGSRSDLEDRDLILWRLDLAGKQVGCNALWHCTKWPTTRIPVDGHHARL